MFVYVSCSLYCEPGLNLMDFICNPLSDQEAVSVHRVKDAAFHFWDAVDDFSRTNMDLIFEHDRLYLHDASGHFGAVPMSITGVSPPQKRPLRCRCYIIAPGPTP